MRLVKIDSDTIAGITGPLDWNPLGTDRSNELTAIYDRTTSAPPAMVITLDLGQVINLFMIKLSDMGGKTAMAPDSSRLTMTMTPHEGHWDLNADLVGTMTLMKSIGSYESEKKKEELDRHGAEAQGVRGQQKLIAVTGFCGRQGGGR